MQLPLRRPWTRTHALAGVAVLLLLSASTSAGAAECPLDPTSGLIWTEGGGPGLFRANTDGSCVHDLLANVFSSADRVAVDPSTGVVYWTNHASWIRIQRSDLSSGDVEAILSYPQVGIDNTEGFAIDSVHGKVYWTVRVSDGQYDTVIRRANLDGTNVETLYGDSSSIRGLGVDGVGGKLYWGQLSDRTLYRGGLDASNPEPLVSFDGTDNYPNGGIALDLAAGKMYFIVGSNSPSTTPPGIRRANLDGSTLETVTSGNDVRGVAVDPADGKLYWSEYQEAFRSDLDGSNPEPLFALGGGRGVALDVARGRLYVADQDPLDPAGFRLLRADLDGSNVVQALTSRVARPEYVSVDGVHGKVYWTDLVRASLARANLDGSDVQDIVREGGDADPTGVAVAPRAGYVYWSDDHLGGIRRAHLDGTSPEEVVTAKAEIPFAIQLDEASGKAYWINYPSDTAPAVIERANLDGSQAEDVVNEDANAIPNSLALDLQRDTFYYSDRGPDPNRIRIASTDGSVADLVLDSAPAAINGVAADPVDLVLYYGSYPSLWRAGLDGSGNTMLLATTPAGEGPRELTWFTVPEPSPWAGSWAAVAALAVLAIGRGGRPARGEAQGAG
jgi:DNA-binding beta-propeller fold protein YncE